MLVFSFFVWLKWTIVVVESSKECGNVLLPAETGTLVISPSVTNILYVTAVLICVSKWKTRQFAGGIEKQLKQNEYEENQIILRYI